MNEFKRILVLGLVTMSVGCTCLHPAPITTATKNEPAASPKPYVVAEFYRLSPVSVPIPTQGASLRRVIADAKDRVTRSGESINAYALNDLPSLNAATNSSLTEQDIQDLEIKTSVTVGGEFIAILRGRVRIFIPSFIIQDTLAGNVQVLPGDHIISFPKALFEFVGVPLKANGDVDETVTEQKNRSFTLTGDYFPEMTVTVSKPFTVRQAFSPKKDYPVKFPEFHKSLMPPNAVALHRLTSDGYIDVSILPFIPPGGSFQHDFPSGKVADDAAEYFQKAVIDGDVIEITRFERLPLVLAGIMTDVAPDVDPAIRNPACIGNGTANQHSWGGHAIRSVCQPMQSGNCYQFLGRLSPMKLCPNGLSSR